MRSKSEISGLIRIVGEKKGLLLGASLFAVLSSLLQTVPFISVFKIVEELLQHARHPENIDKSLIMFWGLAAFIALIFVLVTMYIGGMCAHIAAFNILYSLRLRLCEHLAKVPMGYHSKTAIGELKKIIETSVEKIEKFIAHQLPDLVSAVVVPIVLVGYLFWLDWRMASVLLLPIAFGFWLQARMFGSEPGRQAYREFQFAAEQMNATGVAYIKGMPAVKAFGITAESFLTFKQAVEKYRNISLRITDLFKTPYSLFFVIVSSMFTFVVPVGILAASGDPLNLSFAVTFIFFLVVTPSLSVPILKLLYLGSGLREILEGNKRIEAVLREPIVTEPAVPQVPLSYDIAFEHVTFAYERADSDHFKRVLRDVCFKARTGEMTALVGPSGGGKSTIAQLLLRFWDAQEGVITIGGVPISEIGTDRLMEMVSFVFQDVHLFYDTIEENIRMGNAAATKEAVIAAAKVARCHEFVEKLEQGYETKIGEGGTYLSGGEAQRIAIARALLKNAPILVLDEATAYADAENEHQIQLGLAELVKGKTVLIIAHRLSTIRAAEQILVVQQGEIVERGTHDELRELNGLYERMWQAHVGADAWKLGPAIGGSPHAAHAEGGIR